MSIIKFKNEGGEHARAFISHDYLCFDSLSLALSLSLSLISLFTEEEGGGGEDSMGAEDG